MKLVRAVLIVAVAFSGAVLAKALLKARPQPVAVAQLWSRRQDWQGRTVVVTGTLQSFSDAGGSYCAIEQDGYRVGAAGVTPETVKPLIGARVRATGIFQFSEKGGGFVQIRSILAAGAKS